MKAELRFMIIYLFSLIFHQLAIDFIDNDFLPQV